MLKIKIMILLSVFAIIGTLQADITVKNGAVIASLGDSITDLCRRQPAGYVNLVAAGLEANKIKVQVINAGISGHKSNQMLDRVDSDILSKNVDIMFLSCGVNDVWHQNRNK